MTSLTTNISSASNFIGKTLVIGTTAIQLNTWAKVLNFSQSGNHDTRIHTTLRTDDSLH